MCIVLYTSLLFFVPLKIPINIEIDTFLTVSPALRRHTLSPFVLYLAYLSNCVKNQRHTTTEARTSLVFDFVHNSAQRIVPTVFHESKTVVTKLTGCVF